MPKPWPTAGLPTIGGTPVIRLEDCVGPMIPVADLDDPAALRERFAVLCGPGAAPGAFRGLPPLVLHRTGGEEGLSARATFQVPASAPMFADHFPRRPVFPGSLLVQMSPRIGRFPGRRNSAARLVLDGNFSPF